MPLPVYYDAFYDMEMEADLDGECGAVEVKVILRSLKGQGH